MVLQNSPTNNSTETQHGNSVEDWRKFTQTEKMRTNTHLTNHGLHSGSFLTAASRKLLEYSILRPSLSKNSCWNSKRRFPVGEEVSARAKPVAETLNKVWRWAKSGLHFMLTARTDNTTVAQSNR